MADMTKNDAKISIKLIVDKVKCRVVYAEADHSFVDILFSFLTLPMGTIARLLGKLDDKKFESSFGGLKNLYQSLKDFPECYLSTKECKSMLLNPRSMSYDHYRNLKLKIDDTEPTCSHCRVLIMALNRFTYVFSGNGSGVFVSDIVTFIITNNLCVEPYTSASSIRLLSDLGITDMNHLEERNLEMSSYQILYFLKLAVSIQCPFTYLVFPKIYTLRRFWKFEDNTVNRCNLMKKEISASSKMLLEVSLQKSTGKLLFAEAKEDFVEFLFGVLSIPLGTVIGTLTIGASSSSCMDNIFKSISNMSVGRYLKSQEIKDMLLQPHIGQNLSSKHWFFPLEAILPCPHEQKDPRIDGGFLKQSGMFMVTDDLTITPSSSFSTIEILKKLEVLPDDIERYEVSIGLKEGLSILKASLRSCLTLTNSLDIF